MIYEDANIADFIRLCREVLDPRKTCIDLRYWMDHRDNRGISHHFTDTQIKVIDTLYQYRLTHQEQVELERL